MTEPPVVNERIAQRRAEVRAERRRRRLRRTLTVLVLLAVTTVGVALERSELVALVEVEVVGTERLDPAVVLTAADVPVGTSVLRVRRSAVRDRVVALPLVEDATVERDGALGLRIVVTEVAPALTAVVGDRRLLVSAEGLVLGEGTAPGTPLVVLTGADPAVGSDVTDDPVLAAGHAVALALPGPIRSLVDEVRAVAADDVTLVLEDGTLVRWGGATRTDEKLRALGAVLEDLDGLAVTAIDVTAPSAPTVVP